MSHRSVVKDESRRSETILFHHLDNNREWRGKEPKKEKREKKRKENRVIRVDYLMSEMSVGNRPVVPGRGEGAWKVNLP